MSVEIGKRYVWNHRILIDEAGFASVHEVHYSRGGVPVAWSEKPVVLGPFDDWMDAFEEVSTISRVVGTKPLYILGERLVDRPPEPIR